MLGVLLFGKRKSYWEAKLYESKIQIKVKFALILKNSLKITYDTLSKGLQNIFFDSPVFLWEEENCAIAIWNRSGGKGLLRFTNLAGKYCVEMKDENFMHMHDQFGGLVKCFIWLKKFNDNLFTHVEYYLHVNI